MLLRPGLCAAQGAMSKKQGGGQDQVASSHPSMDLEAGVPTPAQDMQLVMYLRVHELDGVPPTATVRGPEAQYLSSPCSCIQQGCAAH